MSGSTEDVVTTVSTALGSVAGSAWMGPAGAAAGAGAGYNAARDMMKGPSIPSALTTPGVMPVANEAGARQARRRSLIAQMARRGRASTVLTDGEKLG